MAKRKKEEIAHFSKLKHIWWGATTKAGQKRYDNKYYLYKKFCKPETSSFILEIGCGDGEFTKRIVKAGGKIIATDITQEVLERGNRINANRNIRYQKEDAERLSFKNNTFDIVCGISILHHLNTQKALKEAYRVLKPGGVLFFTEPNLFNPVVFLGLNLPFLRNKMEYSPGETALVKSGVRKMLKRAGFSFYKVFNYDFLFPLVPGSLIGFFEKLGSILEKIPILKEISGSLVIYAFK